MKKEKRFKRTISFRCLEEVGGTYGPSVLQVQTPVKYAGFGVTAARAPPARTRTPALAPPPPHRGPACTAALLPSSISGGLF